MCDCVKSKINSQVVDMAVAQALDFEIDLSLNSFQQPFLKSKIM